MLFYMWMLIIILIICILMYLMSTLSMKTHKNKKKLFAFECGFNPFKTPQAPFSMQFFKILLIFLLFDMEIIIVLPLPLYKIQTLPNQILILIIMMILITGLIYEWKEGSLEWLK